jgi:biotin transport system substrate-specific component
MLILAAIFAAVIAVCSQIVIPLAPVPINLATLAVFLTAGFLGVKYGTISTIVYVLLGVIGVPVFAGFKGGAGVIVGPTGGYIIGYIVCAAVSALLLGILCRDEAYTYPKIILSLAAGLFFCYLLGTIWFYIISGWTIGKILMACVVVFLPGDALKIAVASILIKKVRPQVARYL